MSEPAPELSPAHQAGTRAARNTGVQAIGELVGSLASAALFFAMTRTLGQAEVGAYVAATAFVFIAMVVIDLGLDSYMSREVARRRAAVRELFWNVLALRVALAVPVFAVAYVIVRLLPFSAQARETAYILAGAALFYSLTNLVRSIFIAYERLQPIALVIVVQRVMAAALGFAVLAAGGGVRAIAITYGLSTMTGFFLSTALGYRLLGRVPLELSGAVQRRVFKAGLLWVSKDIFMVLLLRLDAVLLAALSTQAAVGRYGAAYLLVDSVAFVTVSLLGAFVAMYAYLGPDTDPPVNRVYERSLKTSLVLLIPVAVTFATLATPLATLLFGAGFATAGEPLRLLAPVCVLLSISGLSASLVISRRSPSIMVAITMVAVALNTGLNFVLIPRYADSGAAMAMLVTAVVYGGLALAAGARTVGRPRLVVTALGPLIAGAGMAAAMLTLSQWLGVALVAGAVAYLAILAIVERVVNPDDFAFVRRLAAQRLTPKLGSPSA